MVFAAILAGGKGERVGGNVPKQFLCLGDQPILIQTINVFLKSKLVDFIYVSVNEAWKSYTEDLLQKYYSDSERKNFKIVLGGKERMMTFLNVIYDIRDTYGIHSEDIVLSHDAVRPFVTTEIIQDCLEKTKQYRVAMASIQSADTTYYSHRKDYLTGTYDRKTLFVGQTPQGCKMDLMYEVISSYTEEELLSMTGTSQLFINRGIDVYISKGSTDNLKITTLNDIQLIEYKLSRQESNSKA